MGKDKASIMLGEETLLQRVCRQASKVVDRIVVVAAADQAIDNIGKPGKLIVDEWPDCGPLAGFLSGLQFLMNDCKNQQTELPEAVCLVACDTPFISPKIISTLSEELLDVDAVVVTQQQQLHPLIAVYSTRILPELTAAFAAGERSPTKFLQRLNVRKLPSHEVCQNLEWLLNINTAEDLATAQAICHMQP